jgi:hypothetical protein
MEDCRSARARAAHDSFPAQAPSRTPASLSHAPLIDLHLLTKGAFEVYQRHLNTNGIIAVHISNHYLDLEPVVVKLARHFGYKLASIDYEESDDNGRLYSSTWVLLSRSEQIINAPAIRSAASIVKTNNIKVPLWTDDFASLFQILC